jgi:hypothetical protein
MGSGKHRGAGGDSAPLHVETEEELRQAEAGLLRVVREMGEVKLAPVERRLAERVTELAIEEPETVARALIVTTRGALLLAVLGLRR